MAEIPVTLGERHTFAVPQTHAYLRKKLGTTLGVQVLTDPAKAISELPRSQIYYVLSVLFPKWAKACPEHEFEGYHSKTDYEAFQRAELAARQYREAEAEWIEGGHEGDAPAPPEPFVDPWDEDHDPAPTPPQMIAAIAASIKVHGGEVIDLLREYAGPKLVEQGFELMAAKAAEARMAAKTQSSTPLLSSPPPSGESASTSSGTTAPTSTENEG